MKVKVIMEETFNSMNVRDKKKMLKEILEGDVIYTDFTDIKMFNQILNNMLEEEIHELAQ